MPQGIGVSARPQNGNEYWTSRPEVKCDNNTKSND
jgi:hypothetical protein